MSTADSGLFQSLHREYHRMVISLCRGFMKGDAEMANDLAQEVFINVWNALPKYRGEASYKTWIYRITVNTCLLQIRKEKNKVRVPLEIDIHDRETASHTAADESEQILYTAIGKLDEVERLMIMMVLDEVEYDEIARILGITENNLRVRIHRVRTKLKTLMENEK